MPIDQILKWEINNMSKVALDDSRTYNEIYKYVDFEGGLKILFEGSIKLSKPEELNDPFDFMIQNLVNPNFQNYKKIYKSNRSLEDLQVTFTKLNDFCRRVGIFCASQCPKNILLWSHYADKHNGMVIGITPSKKGDGMLALCEPVRYTKTKPYFFNNEQDIKNYHGPKGPEYISEYIKDLSMTKEETWSYENELRMWISNCHQIGFIHRLFPEEITSLYLGSRMPPELKIILTKFAKKNYPIYRFTKCYSTLMIILWIIRGCKKYQKTFFQSE